jgi:hypothetical protein
MSNTNIINTEKKRRGRPKKNKLVKDSPQIHAYIPAKLSELIDDFIGSYDKYSMSKNQLVILSLISYLKNYGVQIDADLCRK